MKRANNILIYGDTNRYKTTNVGRFARYIYETTGKRTRLISADGGGWEPIQAYVDSGIIEPLRVVEVLNPLSLIRVLQEGLWPEMEGNQIAVNDKGLVKVTKKGLEDVGAYAIEGLTSLGSLILRWQATSGVKIGEDVVGKFQESVVVDGRVEQEIFSSPARAHYGFAQNTVMDLLIHFSALPVSRVLFTAHEGKGQDDVSNQPVYGPQAVGKALTSRIPMNVGDMLHFDAVPNKEGKLEARAYYETHPDHYTRIPWPAKVRLEAQEIPQLQARFPGGFIPLTMDQGIEVYLAFQDGVRSRGAEELRKWKEQIDARKA